MPSVTDGTFTTPAQNGRRQQEYPFAYLGNSFAKRLSRRFIQLGSSFRTANTTQRASYANQITSSEDFAGGWTAVGGTITGAAIENPNDGLVTGTRFTEDTANSGHNMAKAYTATAVPHVLSICVAPFSGTTWIALQYIDSAAANHFCFFRIYPTGLVGTSALITSSRIVVVQPAPNIGAVQVDWLRCEIVFTPAAGTGTINVYVCNADGTVVHVGDTSFHTMFYGAQMEKASSPGPYIVTTAATRSVASPSTDDTNGNTNPDPFAFLCDETAQSEGMLEIGLCEFTRGYARIPATQIEYSTKLFNRPIMDDVFISSVAWAISFDRGITSHVFTSRKTVSSVGTYTPSTTSVTNPAGALAALPNHIVFMAQTNGLSTTFLLNGSPSSIRAQLISALPQVTGLTVEGTGNSLVIQWTGGVTYCYTTSLSVQASFSTSGVTFTAFASSTTSTYTPQAASSLRVINSTTHGGAVGDLVALWNGDSIIGRGQIISVPSANSFTIPIDSLPGSDFAVTTCQFGKNGTRYVNGIKSCTIRRSRYFYLPGFTAGISTAADIPNFAIYTDPISWLGRLISAPTGFAAVEVSELDFWMGPIYTQAVDEIQMADAIDTVTP